MLRRDLLVKLQAGIFVDAAALAADRGFPLRMANALEETGLLPTSAELIVAPSVTLAHLLNEERGQRLVVSAARIDLVQTEPENIEGQGHWNEFIDDAGRIGEAHVVPLKRHHLTLGAGAEIAIGGRPPKTSQAKL